jgi:hypothetical protein
MAGWVAQLVEQRTENPCVGGSIPPPATTSNCECSKELGGCEGPGGHQNGHDGVLSLVLLSVVPVISVDRGRDPANGSTVGSADNLSAVVETERDRVACPWEIERGINPFRKYKTVKH